MASTGARSTDNAENPTATRTIGLTVVDRPTMVNRPKITAKIYLQCLGDVDETQTVSVTIETFIVLFVYNYLNRPIELKLYLVVDHTATVCTTAGALAAVRINVGDFRYTQLSRTDYGDELTALCNFPVALTSERVVIAGLCGVCRCLVKSDVRFAALLGFKGACLLSPSESSIWTKFCEVDIVECVRSVLSNTERCSVDMPEALSQFEGHLSQPIRIHNVYKLAREVANERYRAKQQRADEDNLVTKLETLSVNANEGVQTDCEDTARVPRLNKSKVSCLICNTNGNMGNTALIT